MEIITYSKEIQTIHNEVRDASENVLKEAKNILKEHQEMAKEKAERLIKEGFKNSKEAKVLINLAKSAKTEGDNIDKIKYYQEKYPLYKFILKRDIENICEKYGLVYGEVELFKGFVPEINLKEIENFKIDFEDRQIMWGGRWGAKGKIGKMLSSFSERRQNILIQGRTLTIKEKVGKDKRYQWTRTKRYYFEPIQIIAPVGDMELTGKKIVKNQIVDIPPKDPVVLCPVRGGYLLVTAWGDEASDPIVMNPKLN